MLPTFLGIGAPKAGTTWLYQLLDSHPDVQMSRDRKELHYFDWHFEQGTGWYESFFPDSADRMPAAVGEYTTHYLYQPEVPARVPSVPSIDRFILLVRNPVDRAFSHYRFRRRLDNLSMSFEEFLVEVPDAYELGNYGRHLSTWLEHFSPDRFLVLVYEHAVRNTAETKAQLGHHLGIRPELFPAAVSRVNESFVPRRPGLYTAAVRAGRSLRRLELDRVITMAKRTGAVDLVKRPRPAPRESVPDPLRRQLWERFAPDVALLEQIAGVDLGIWREGAG